MRATNKVAERVIPASILVAALALGLACLQDTSVFAQEGQKFRVWDLGVLPRAAADAVLLSLPAVQEELKLTDEQKKEHEAIGPRFMQKRQQAPGREG